MIDVDPNPKKATFDLVEKGSKQPDSLVGSKGTDKPRGQKKKTSSKVKKVMIISMVKTEPTA